jgi:hypothetical protein
MVGLEPTVGLENAIMQQDGLCFLQHKRGADAYYQVSQYVLQHHPGPASSPMRC